MSSRSTSSGNTPQYRRYRAPAQHGEKFCDPPLDEFPRLLAENVRARSDWQLAIGGEAIPQLVSTARSDLFQAAADYTRQYRDLPASDIVGTPNVPFLLAGHQPRLFHPGVWWKNFLISQLAAQATGVAINLVIDNDLCGSPTIRVPSGTSRSPHLETIAYDQGAADIPFEERPLLDPVRFDSFGERVTQCINSLVEQPMIRDWWSRAKEAARHEPNLGRCIAQARHQCEAEWGLSTLEIPLSRICETRSFRRFVVHVCHDLPQLLSIYNEALFEYRRVNHVRSRSHPVPELEQAADGWREAPLWVWDRRDPRRRRLFARHGSGGLQLSDLGQNVWSLPDPERSGYDRLLDELERISQAGVRIRPRALATTMYARVVLSDLFVHGIGGGKYDQLTDAILQSWLNIVPPRFIVATATAQLPVDRPKGTAEDLRRVERSLRDLHFNPDRFLARTAEAQSLIHEKRSWLANQPQPDAGRARHAALTRIHSALQPYVAERQTALRAEREQLVETLRHERLLGSREFAFCLFPESTLRPLLLDNA